MPVEEEAAALLIPGADLGSSLPQVSAIELLVGPGKLYSNPHIGGNPSKSWCSLQREKSLRDLEHIYLILCAFPPNEELPAARPAH